MSKYVTLFAFLKSSQLETVNICISFYSFNNMSTKPQLNLVKQTSNISWDNLRVDQKVFSKRMNCMECAARIIQTEDQCLVSGDFNCFVPGRSYIILELSGQTFLGLGLKSFFHR